VNSETVTKMLLTGVVILLAAMHTNGKKGGVSDTGLADYIDLCQQGWWF
jgi:hypothetical protein